MLLFLLSISDESNSSKIEYIYNNFHNDMLRFAKTRLKNSGLPNYLIDAEDSVQNAFMKIVKYIDSIDFSVSQKELKAYVITIVANETANIIASYREISDLDENVADLDDCEFFERLHIKDRYEQVIKAIAGLDEKYSITLMYYYQNDMSVNEIAGLMGISAKTVYSRLSRGKRLLIDLMEGAE